MNEQIKNKYYWNAQCYSDYWGCILDIALREFRNLSIDWCILINKIQGWNILFI